ncbi:hypothetical protein [Paraburkholderia azotifigens]|uniref:Uncharacterized protein n=1 Tax=Paraburkholderia azotifigens TaxID=2057004 RepID=A0ABU9R7R0_9BURK|nr:hypothetical protein [Paraburkholderia azotifigens]
MPDAARKPDRRRTACASGNLKAGYRRAAAVRIACSNVFSESAICFAARIARCYAHVERGIGAKAARKRHEMAGSAGKRNTWLNAQQGNFTALIKVF